MRRLAIALVSLVLTEAAPAAAANPLSLISSVRLDPRLEQLTFRTPAVIGPTSVRVLLPAGYAAHSVRRYPVLYMLHGALDNYTSWTAKGDAERLTAGYPLIVVMPDTGRIGGYTNWWRGPPKWETYHIDELLPWIDAHFRTLPVRAERAILGLSMGGFGAMSHAARHPDLFAAAASFSGAVDTNNPLDIAVTPVAPFGQRATQEVRWRAHNPWDLAANLRGLKLVIRTGNGQPGGPFGGGDIVETAVHEMSVSFHDRLVQLGIPSLWDDYGPGGHDWPYWQRDLRETLPQMMAVFAHPEPPPSSFAFTAVEPRYGVYGWSVTLARPALEFSTLRVTGRNGFSITGSGTATVTTAPLYGSDKRMIALVGGRAAGVAPAPDGRITVTLSLGPGNRDQEFTPQAVHRHSVTTSVRLMEVR
jgi:S-formylglutathione hydrolase FrmB